MGVGAGLYMYDSMIKKVTFAMSSPDEFLVLSRRRRARYSLFIASGGKALTSG